jgi:hypothetical protein
MLIELSPDVERNGEPVLGVDDQLISPDQEHLFGPLRPTFHHWHT